MTWQSLLASGRLKRHTTSRQEISDLRDLIERDLKDARVELISADRRFATAYNAVLQLAKIVIACSGYRVSGLAHHQTTFEALELAMGAKVSKLVAYFDTCRRKRNQVDYDFALVASDTEVEDLLANAEEFCTMVEQWVQTHHPIYATRKA
jgi:uncharacterized protein (UPF0332 family)